MMDTDTKSICDNSHQDQDHQDGRGEDDDPVQNNTTHGGVKSPSALIYTDKLEAEYLKLSKDCDR
jgi:hypothetical protein